MKKALAGITIAIVTFIIGFYATAYWAWYQLSDYEVKKSSVHTKPSQLPDNWKYINADNSFGFYVPPDMKKDEVQGIDSYVGKFHNNGLELSFDYGIYSDPLEYSKEPDYKEVWVKIDGKSAKIVTFHKPSGYKDFSDVAAVHFPQIGKETKLTMWVYCKSPDEQQVAKTIFSSIQF